MHLILGINDNDVDTRHDPKGGFNHYFNRTYIYKGSRGWGCSCSNFAYESAENEFISTQLLEVMTSFEWKTQTSKPEHYRQEGIYEVGDVKIVVINKAHSQEIEFTGRSIDTFRRALVALRNGEIHPKYPLVRKQESPTYDALAETISEQTKTIRRLVEQLETANNVVNDAQQLLIRAGICISNLKKVADRVLEVTPAN